MYTKYVKLSFTNVMNFLETARTFRNNEEYFKNKEGTIHKVEATYNHHGSSIIDLKINNHDMGYECVDLGEAYDYIKSCIS
jgi:hypothetical protein